MHGRLNFIGVVLFLIATAIVPANAQSVEKRIALVIGNANYQAGALQTPANDAGLIAQTLQAAGFDVVGARDLDQDSLRRAFRDFIDKAQASGPDTVAVVYLSGYALQVEGENYFVPVDARIARDTDVATEALRLSDYTKPLAAGLKATIVIVDGARANPFARSGGLLAGGLALVEPEPETLIAFNAAPGTIAPESPGPYSPYAQALVEMIREGGLPLNDLFERVRLRVNDTTRGADVPWDASKVQAPFMFFERAPDAPPPDISPEQTSALQSRPLRDLGAQDAYLAALQRDTLRDYEDFLGAFPGDPMALRVRAIVAVRREALTWRHTRDVNTPPAYWSYLRRYPRGAHAEDARRRLADLAAAFEPPPSFVAIAYDVPPPLPDEVIYVDRPVVVFDDPEFGFAPPPMAPVMFLPPRPAYIVDLRPPPPPWMAFALPAPVYAPVPLWVRTPPMVAPPPPNNVIFNNLHNTVAVNPAANTVTITNPGGRSRTVAPAQAIAPAQAAVVPAGRGQAPVTGLGPTLPPSVATKAAVMPNAAPGSHVNGPPGVGARPGVPLQALTTPPNQPVSPNGQALPGANGRPLPPFNGGPSGSPPQPPRSFTTGQPPARQAVPAGQAAPGVVNGNANETAVPSTTVHPPGGPVRNAVKPLGPIGQQGEPATTNKLAPVGPPVVHPPAAALHPTPPPPHPAPPPAIVARPTPPPVAAVRPPPPPPPVAHPPPAVVARPAPPPAAAKPAPAAAAKKCVLPNGQPCPPPR